MKANPEPERAIGCREESGNRGDPRYRMIAGYLGDLHARLLVRPCGLRPVLADEGCLRRSKAEGAGFLAMLRRSAHGVAPANYCALNRTGTRIEIG
ncbi:MAG: hypothetical protein WBW73_20725 [Rhodoplanes sp.]